MSFIIFYYKKIIKIVHFVIFQLKYLLKKLWEFGERIFDISNTDKKRITKFILNFCNITVKIKYFINHKCFTILLSLIRFSLVFVMYLKRINYLKHF